MRCVTLGPVLALVVAPVAMSTALRPCVPAERAPQQPLQLVLFADRERSGFAGFQTTEHDRTEPNAHETFDLEADGLAEASNLAIAPFCDGDLEFRCAVPERPRFDRPWPDQAVFELDTSPCGSDREPNVPADGRDVRALDLGAWVCELVRRVAVGREQQNALGEVVESTDVGEPGYAWHQFENGAAPFGVGLRSYDAGWLVQHNPLERVCRPTKLAPIDGDAIDRRIHRLSRTGDDAVHLHSARRHELLGLSARRDTRPRERAVNSHRFAAHDVCAASGAGSVGVVLRSAIASSSPRGNSSRCRSANCSRKIGVVPYRSGRPIPSARPTTSMRPRSSSDLSTLPTATPRISSISARPMGWRYAMIANVSSDAPERR